MIPLLAILAAFAHAPVSCATVLPSPGAAGVYDTYAHTIILRADECARLELLYNGARPRSLYSQRDFAEALWIAGHEAAHARGIADERRADCAGVTSLPTLARRLGVGKSYAVVLQGYASAALLKECG